MSTKPLNGECQHCGGQFTFPAESVGLTSACPHCGRRTELLLATPPQEPTVPVKTMIYTALAVLILLGGLVGAMIAVNRLQHTAQQRKSAAVPDRSTVPATTNGFTAAGFRISTITLEKTPGSSAVYAVGTIRNTAARPRRDLKVELELLNAAGQRVGTTAGQHSALEPNAEWRFKMLVEIPKVASARIISIKDVP
jgi:hypothetical protein